MPTLDEVFALAPKGKFLFNIETKISAQRPELAPPPEEFVRLVLAAIRKHHLESRVVLQSFDFRTLHEMKKLAPEIRLSALYSGAPKASSRLAAKPARRSCRPSSTWSRRKRSRPRTRRVSKCCRGRPTHRTIGPSSLTPA